MRNDPPVRLSLRAVSAALALAALLDGCGGAPPTGHAPLAGGAEALPDRSLFFGVTAAADGVLSPDGQTLAFLRPHRGALNVWLRPTSSPSAAARPLTDSATDRVKSIAFSADGRFLLFSRDEDGNERDRLFAIDLHHQADRSPRALTPAAGVSARLVAVPDADPHHIVVTLNERSAAYHDLERIRLIDGQRTTLRDNRGDITRWWVDSAGQPALALAVAADGATTILDVRNSATREVLTCAFADLCIPLRMHADGQQFYLIDNRDTDLTRLSLVALADGRIRELHRDPEHAVDLANALFSRRDGRLLAVTYLGQRQRIYPQDPEFAAQLARIEAALPEADLTLRSPTADDRHWIVKEITDVDDGTNYLYRVGDATLTPLYESFPNLPRARMARREAVSYVARDGTPIPAYLTRPKDDATGAAVVLVHGGPWQRDTWGWDARAQFLASRGYAVLQPNYRGSTGYGKAWTNAGNGAWGHGAMQTDVEDAARWLAQTGIADAGRIAIMGNSYGGYAALAGLAFTPERFAAGVAIAAPSSLPDLLDAMPLWWQPQQELIYRRIGDPQRDAVRLRAASPLYAADRIRAPLLLAQGANDPRVDAAQSTGLATQLARRGAAVRLLLFDGQGHDIVGADRLTLMAAVEHFLADHLGGRAQPLAAPLARRLEQATVATDAPGK